MKKLLIFVFLLSSYFAISQTTGAAPPLQVWSKMWSITSTYSGYFVTHDPSDSRRDSSGTSIIMYSAYRNSTTSTTVAPFSVSPISGYGNINFTAYVWKGQKVSTTVNPVVTCTLTKSNDGVYFTPVVGATIFTLTPTSLTTPKIATWDLTGLWGRFYGVEMAVTVDTASAVAGYFLNKASSYNLGRN